MKLTAKQHAVVTSIKLMTLYTYFKLKILTHIHNICSKVIDFSCNAVCACVCANLASHNKASNGTITVMS